MVFSDGYGNIYRFIVTDAAKKHIARLRFILN